MKRIWKYLTASTPSIVCLIALIVGVLAICAIEIRSCTPELLPSLEESENVDAAGLETTSDQTSENSINTTQLPDNSFLYDTKIEELASADSYMDGQTVQVTGEVVGDRIISDDPNYCWITLQSTDGKSDAELSVYMPLNTSELIDTYGAYGKRGTQLQVRGTFNLACPQHNGTSELHSENVSIVEKGKVEEIPFEPRRMVPGIALIMVGCALILLYNTLRERQK